MTRRSPAMARERTYQALTRLIGNGGVITFLVIVLLLVTLGWFTDTLFEWMSEWWEPAYRWIAIAAFVISWGGALWFASRATREIRPRVSQEERPAPVQGLVIYLSTLAKGRDFDHTAELTEALEAEIDLDTYRTGPLGRHSWRMPVEAIAYHRERLREVVLIGSPGEQGSGRQRELFLRLTDQLFPEREFEILDISLIDPQFANGVDFARLDAVTEATDQAFGYLQHTRRVAAREILIDVTGGFKTTSIGAAVAALAEGKRFQYVSSQRSAAGADYQVQVYDVTYTP